MPKKISPDDKIAALQDKLKAAKAEATVAKQRRLATLGKCVAELMTTDAAFQAAIIAKLKTVSNTKDKADLAPFLAPSNGASAQD